MLAAYRLVDPTGEVPVSDHAVPQKAVFPPQFWQQGETVVEERSLELASTGLPGKYVLQMRLLDETGVIDVPSRGDGGKALGWVDIGEFRVRPRIAEELPPAPGTSAVYGDQISLVGHSPLTAVPSGDDYALTLYWRADRAPEADFHVSIQVLDQAGWLRAQHDGVPYDGRYPFSRWDVGEIVPDLHRLAMAGLPAGQYQIVVVVYRPENGVRLPVDGGDSHVLGTLTLEGK